MDESEEPEGTAATGDTTRDAFAEFFRNQYRPTVGMIMVAGGTQEEAEDATVQAMKDAFTKWSQITKPRPWVRRAAKNYFLKARQRDRDHLKIVIKRGVFTPEAETPVGLSTYEDQQWVTMILNELTPTQRRIFALFFDDLTAAEIAELLGKKEATVRKNIQHARERLRSRLDKTTLELNRPRREALNRSKSVVTLRREGNPHDE